MTALFDESFRLALCHFLRHQCLSPRAHSQLEAPWSRSHCQMLWLQSGRELHLA